MLFDPFSVGQHAFLVTTGAEIAGLAGKGQQVIMATVVTVSPGKPLMQITTIQEAGQDLLFHRAGEVPARLKFLVVADHTLIQRACPGIAGPVDTTGGGAGIHASGDSVAS